LRPFGTFFPAKKNLATLPQTIVGNGRIHPFLSRAFLFFFSFYIFIPVKLNTAAIIHLLETQDVNSLGNVAPEMSS
jgi:hypothetical protein